MSASLWKDEELKFADEKSQWLAMIRYHIVANLGIEPTTYRDVGSG